MLPDSEGHAFRAGRLRRNSASVNLSEPRRRPQLRSALVEVHASWPTRMPLAAPLFPHLLA